MSGGILVAVEHMRGEITETSYEILGAGRRIADALEEPLFACLLGEGVSPMAARLGRADSVLVIEKPGWRFPMTSESARVVWGLMQKRGIPVALVAGSNLCMGFSTTLAAISGLPLVNFCTNFRVQDQIIHVTSNLFGGKILAETSLPENRGILCIRPGTFPPDEGRSEKAPTVEPVDLPVEPPRIAFRSFIEPEAGDIDITKQNILVSVGRGIQNKENIEIAEELAKVLGSAVSCSRPVVDQGWLPLSRQVGKSGMNVKPKIYLALGISGAPEHQEGMKNASIIIAINTDPNAPIFDVARYGAVQDLFDIVPALVEAVQARKRDK